MAIIRVIKNKDYTVMSNTHLKDKRLSLKAIGLLSVVLSLPDGWNYTINGLVGVVKDGKDSVESAIKELKKHGYLKVDKIYPNGNCNRIQYRYTFFENPQEVDFQPLENQDIEKQEVESQVLENPHAYKDTNRLNTNRLNTNKENKHKFGEYHHVLLTEDEYERLKDLYGGYKQVEEHIKILDEYIETSGKSYKNHSLVLQKWVHDEWAKRNKNKPVKLDSKFYVQESNQSYADVHKEMERVRKEILGA